MWTRTECSYVCHAYAISVILFILTLMLLGPRSRDTYGDDNIKSEVIYAGERRYYLDLKENSRGRFLKVTAFTAVFTM